MAGVMVPQRKTSSMNSLLPLAGTIVGQAVGGPPGAAIGGAAGNAASSLSTKDQGPQPVSTAMQRRMDTLQQSPTTQLAQANVALTQLPGEYQQAYGPTLKQAMERDSLSRGYA